MEKIVTAVEKDPSPSYNILVFIIHKGEKE